MKFLSILLTLVALVQSAAVLTDADCSDISSTCPTDNCCGTGVKDTSVAVNGATVDVQICRNYTESGTSINPSATANHYIFTCNSY